MNIVGLGLPGHSEIILIVFIVYCSLRKKITRACPFLGKSLSEFKRGQKEDVAQEESSKFLR